MKFISLLIQFNNYLCMDDTMNRIPNIISKSSFLSDKEFKDKIIKNIIVIHKEDYNEVILNSSGHFVYNPFFCDLMINNKVKKITILAGAIFYSNGYYYEFKKNYIIQVVMIIMVVLYI